MMKLVILASASYMFDEMPKRIKIFKDIKSLTRNVSLQSEIFSLTSSTSGSCLDWILLRENEREVKKEWENWTLVYRVLRWWHYL